MNLLLELVSSRVRMEILRLLFGIGTPSLHARELQRRSRQNANNLHRELRKLSRLGLLLSRRDGNRLYYQANRSHPLYPEIRGLVLKTVGLAEVLRQALSDPNIRWAFVFGSIAGGTETAESDIDLMVIGDLGLRKVSGLLSGVGMRLGREVNPHVFPIKEFLDRLARREHFVTQVLDGPRLFIVGAEDEFAGVVRERLA
jgi:predicted nucleotidyltransferase